MSLNLDASDAELRKQAEEAEAENFKSGKRLKLVLLVLSPLMLCLSAYWEYQVLFAPGYDRGVNESIDARLNTRGAKTTGMLDREYTEVTTTYKGGARYSHNEYTYSFQAGGRDYYGETTSPGSYTSRAVSVVYDPENPNLHKIEGETYDRYQSLSSMYQGTFLAVGAGLIIFSLWLFKVGLSSRGEA